MSQKLEGLINGSGEKNTSAIRELIQGGVSIIGYYPQVTVEEMESVWKLYPAKREKKTLKNGEEKA